MIDRRSCKQQPLLKPLDFSRMDSYAHRHGMKAQVWQAVKKIAPKATKKIQKSGTKKIGAQRPGTRKVGTQRPGTKRAGGTKRIGGTDLSPLFEFF